MALGHGLGEARFCQGCAAIFERATEHRYDRVREPLLFYQGRYATITTAVRGEADVTAA